MATKSNPVQLNPVLSVSSIALDNTKLPDYAADNYILWLVTWGNNSTVSSLTGGWSHQDAISSSGAGISQSAVYKKAASSAESNPTLTLSGTPNCIIATGYVIKGADLTNFLDGGDGVGYKTAFGDTGTANTLTTGTLTPANNNALIFCVCGAKDESAVRFRQEDLNGDVLRNSNAGLLTQVIGYKQQNTAATDGGWVAYIDAARRTSSLTIAIKDDGNNTRAKDGRTAVIRINWYGLLGAAHDGAWTSAAPSTMAGGNLGTMGIKGVTVSTTNLAAPTTSALITGWGNGSMIATTEVAAVWSGKYHSFSSIDASGTLFSVNWMSENTTALMGNDGLLVVFADGNNQWVAFQLSQKLGILSADPRLSVIDLEYGTQFDASENYPGSGGAAIDWTDLTECAYLYLRNASGSGTRSFSVKDALLHPKSGYVLRGGSEDDPLTPSFASVAVNGWGYRNLVGHNVGSKEQVVSRFSITIGDGGTTPTYFNANGSSYEYPEAFDLSTQNTFNIPADALTLNINAGSSDSMLFESCAVVAGQQQAFETDAASSTLANYGFGGAAIKGWAFTDNAGIAIPNATYSYCDTVALKGNATNVTITNTTSTNATASWNANGATADSCTIDGTGALYAVELGTAVTAITLTDCTITAGSTDKVHVLKTTGTVTITISGTTSLAAGDVTSEGATVSIVSDPVTQEVTINGFTSGSRVQIYDYGVADTELYNDVVVGTTITWTDSVAAANDRDIRVRISYVSGTSAKEFIEANIGTCGTTSGTEVVTYLANQVDDEVYNANAVNGSLVAGITFTDAATDLINCNIAGGTVSWGELYAAFVYWISTAAGIADDIAYVEAVDQSNYLLTSMQIKNINATPLTLTGGWGRDSTTLTIADIIDTAGSTGNIFPLPDHVVNNIVTVGGVNVITGDIADVPTASEIATAVTTDPKTLTVAKFLGLK